MPRSLVWKFMLMLTIVLMTVMVMEGILMSLATINRVIIHPPGQGRDRFTADVMQHYLENGSFDGLLESIRQQSKPPPPPRRIFPGYAVADVNGILQTRYPPNYEAGDRLSQAELAEGTPLEVDGEVVGFILATNDGIELNITEALLLALIIPCVVAFSLAFVLARFVTHPLRELTIAATAVADGELGRQVPVKTQDEIGKLTVAFNQMSRDLAEASQLRRQMTADIAHDLRTPLTILGGYIDSAHAGFLSLSQDHLETMYGEIERLEHMVSDLRTLAKADAKQLRLNLQPIPPQALLERTAKSYQHQADIQEITLKVEASEKLPPIKIDEEQMTRVLGNLLSNALRYTPQTKQGLIRLASAIKNGYVHLTVEDNGQGIPPEHLPNIFHRFYRADESRQRNASHGESGLGLAIAKSLVEAHGGTIAVESVLKQGTKFTIALPASG